MCEACGRQLIWDMDEHYYLVAGEIGSGKYRICESEECLAALFVMHFSLTDSYEEFTLNNVATRELMPSDLEYPEVVYEQYRREAAELVSEYYAACMPRR